MTTQNATLTGLGFTEEQLEFRDLVRDFADTVVAPASYEHDRAHTFPYEIVAQMGEMGLFGLPIPEEYGGQGGSHVELCIALEQLGRIDQSVAITLEAGVGLGMMPILHTGTEEQKQEWLPQLATGGALAGFGLTEPEAGSDAGATRTTAVLDNGEWLITGAKQFITNSGTDITKLVTITAVTGRSESGKPELSAVLLPSGTPGFEVGQAYDKVGWNASDTHPLSFQDARVPEANLLGERGRGYANFLKVLDEGRVAIAALATGVAQGCLEQAVDYAKTRNVFGQPIGSNQHIAFLLARMQVRTHTARLATFDAAQRIAAGLPFKTEASIAKLVASEAAMDNARDATQIFGGYGFMNEYVVARHYRDSKILEIGEGTTEVQLTLIARELGF